MKARGGFRPGGGPRERFLKVLQALLFRKAILGGRFNIILMFFLVLGESVLGELGGIGGEGHKKATRH